MKAVMLHILSSLMPFFKIGFFVVFLLQVKCTLFITGLPKNAKQEAIEGHFM